MVKTVYFHIMAEVFYWRDKGILRYWNSTSYNSNATGKHLPSMSQYHKIAYPFNVLPLYAKESSRKYMLYVQWKNYTTYLYNKETLFTALNFYSIGYCSQLFMYRINNELVLNSQNESTYLEGPLGPERGWFILIIQYQRVVYHT